jgi:hypothetical protein
MPLRPPQLPQRDVNHALGGNYARIAGDLTAYRTAKKCWGMRNPLPQGNLMPRDPRRVPYAELSLKGSDALTIRGPDLKWLALLKGFKSEIGSSCWPVRINAIEEEALA